MAIHWTDFPERVETFGDLLSIYETLERDIRKNHLPFGLFNKRTNQSAYDIEVGGMGEVIPRSDRVPGWDALATFAEQEFSTPPSLYVLRQIRGQASKALAVDLKTVNEMSITAVLEALAETDREPNSPPTSPQPDDGIKPPVVEVPPHLTTTAPADSGIRNPLMSAPAWSALADRFAELAAEQEFDLCLYSIENHHYPSAIPDGAVRFVSAAHIVRERTGFPAIALVGSPTWSANEFRRFNRFRWLAWTAGRLLCSTASRPELDWLFSVHRSNAERVEMMGPEGRLRSLIAASGATASKYAEDGSRDAPPPVSSGALVSGPWQEPMRSLRAELWKHATTQFDFHLELLGYTNPGPFGVEGRRIEQIQQHAIKMGRGINSQIGAELVYWTDTEPGGTFIQLAEHAGRQLPAPFIPSIRLLPPGLQIWGRDQPSPLVAWAEFLWMSNPQNYQTCSDSQDPGARKAVWKGGNPFMASALAIDQFIQNYGPETLAQYNRRIVEVCPWFSGPEDRSAAATAIEAAFSPPPISETGGPGNPYTLGKLRIHRQAETAASRRVGKDVCFDIPNHYTTDPAFRRLEAYLNARGDEATPKALLQLRGEVCHACNCITTDADMMTLEEVANALDCPGGVKAPTVQTPAVPTQSTTDAASASNQPYTLSDISALLRYKREQAEYQTRLRSINPTEMMGAQFGPSWVKAKMDRSLTAPTPPRLTVEQAVAFSSYRWLMRASLTDWERPLDEETLLLLVGEVASNSSESVEVLMALPLDEFEQIRDWGESESADGDQGDEEDKENAQTGSGEMGSAKSGRPNLELSADPKDRKLANVYRLIVKNKRPGMGPKKLIPLLKSDRSLMDLIQEAGVVLDKALIRAAVEYNRRQSA